MKLPFVRVLPVVFALMIPSAAFAATPADTAPTESTAATHVGAKPHAKSHTKAAKKPKAKPKAKAKAKRAKTPSKSPKSKSGKKAATKG